jgi:plastocyanin
MMKFCDTIKNIIAEIDRFISKKVIYNFTMEIFKSIVFVLVLLLVYPALHVAAEGQAVYRVFVDEDYGFRQVRELNGTPFVYENLTLVIKPGDTVIWVNDATDNSEMTIISEQNLWDNRSAYLRYTYHTFNYTFSEPGTYSVFVKENPRIRPQTIVVKSIETPTQTATPAETPTQTATPAGTPTQTATPAGTPMEAAPTAFNLWYILFIAIIVIGIILFLYSSKRK